MKLKQIKPIPFIFNVTMALAFITILAMGLMCIHAILFTDISTMPNYNPAETEGIFYIACLFVVAGLFGLSICDKDKSYIKTDEEMINND